MKHKWKPLNSTHENICSATKVYFVDGKKFLEGMRHEHMYFSIIPKDVKEEVEELLAKVVDLLEYFLDIVSYNVLDELSLVKKTSHQMELILGEIFSNKKVHIMSPIKIEDFTNKCLSYYRRD